MAGSPLAPAIENTYSEPLKTSPLEHNKASPSLRENTPHYPACTAATIEVPPHKASRINLLQGFTAFAILQITFKTNSKQCLNSAFDLSHQPSLLVS